MLGKLIKQARKSKGISQSALGTKIGKAARTIQDYEYDKAIPPIKVLQQIADALNIAISDLLIPPASSPEEQAERDFQIAKNHASMTEFTVHSIPNNDSNIFLSLPGHGCVNRSSVEINKLSFTRAILNAVLAIEAQKINMLSTVVKTIYTSNKVDNDAEFGFSQQVGKDEKDVISNEIPVTKINI